MSRGKPAFIWPYGAFTVIKYCAAAKVEHAYWELFVRHDTRPLLCRKCRNSINLEAAVRVAMWWCPPVKTLI